MSHSCSPIEHHHGQRQGTVHRCFLFLYSCVSVKEQHCALCDLSCVIRSGRNAIEISNQHVSRDTAVALVHFLISHLAHLPCDGSIVQKSTITPSSLISSNIITLSHPPIQVLVMDMGRVAEYNSPANLLADKDSMFSILVADAESSSHSD